MKKLLGFTFSVTLISFLFVLEFHRTLYGPKKIERSLLYGRGSFISQESLQREYSKVARGGVLYANSRERNRAVLFPQNSFFGEHLTDNFYKQLDIAKDMNIRSETPNPEGDSGFFRKESEKREPVVNQVGESKETREVTFSKRRHLELCNYWKAKFDKNKDGILSENERAMGSSYVKMLYTENIRQRKDLYFVLDEDRDGKLSSLELTQADSALREIYEENCSERNNLLDAFDSDGDGELSGDELNKVYSCSLF
jgi:hypothetical protein